MSRQSAARISRVLLILLFVYLGCVTVATVLAASTDLFAVLPEQYEYLYDAMELHGALAMAAAGAFILMRRMRESSVRVPRVICLVALVCLLVSADRVINVLQPPDRDYGGLYQVHPIRGWSHIPRRQSNVNEPIRIDAMGFRVPWDGPVRSIDDQLRILFVGDSLTFGFGVKARNSFCEKTVATLNERHHGLQAVALNAGVCGYDTRQELHLLNDLGFKLEPSLVVLQICLNDFTRQFSMELSDVCRPAEFAGAMAHNHWSGLYRVVQKCGEFVRYRGQKQSAAESIQFFEMVELLSDPPSELVQKSWHNMELMLRRFVNDCRTRDIPLAVVVFPVSMQLSRDDLTAWPQEQIRRFAAEIDVPLLDLRPTYRRLIDREIATPNELYMDLTHPTVRGHQIATDAIVHFLETEGLVSRVLATSQR